jgi:hypothetical protein
MIDQLDLIAAVFLIYFLFNEHYILASVLMVVGFSFWILKESVK